MRKKSYLFVRSIKLVWQSAPGWTISSVLASLISSITPLLILWLLKMVVDNITGAASHNTAFRIIPLLSLAALWFIDESLSDISNYIRKRQSYHLESFMYGLLHSKSVRIDLINFEKPEYYDCLSRAAAEAPWRPNEILNNIISAFRASLSVLIMAVLLVRFNWIAAAVLIAANIPGIWLRLHYSDILYSFRKNQTPEARKASYYNWLLTGDRPSREIRLFGLGNYFRKLFNESFRKQKETELEIIRKRSLVSLFSNLFKAAAFLGVVILVGRRTIEGSITLGAMAMFILAFRQGMMYIREMLGALAGLYEDSLFIGDTFEFLDLKEDIKAEEPVEKPADLREGIAVKGLTFRYPGAVRKTIDNISFRIKKGEVLALVGPNGAGKTTLARLICRFYDAESGTIEYDGTSIRNFDPGEYRKKLSVIFQDFMLYNLPAGENIRLGDEERTDHSAITAAAKKTGIDRIIEGLPAGYDSQIGNLFEDGEVMG